MEKFALTFMCLGFYLYLVGDIRKSKDVFLGGVLINKLKNNMIEVIYYA